MISKNTWNMGLKSGWSTTWELGKIVFPVTIIMTVLKFTPVIGWAIYLFTPLMKWIGLPGEAAIPLVLGNILNLYAAIGAIISLELTVKHVFILAVMLSFSHNLIFETAIARKIGVNAIIVIGVRVGLAVLSGIIISLLWNGGEGQAHYTMQATNQPIVGNWLDIGLLAVKTAVLGIWQIAVIVFPLMVFIQILKDINAIKYFSNFFGPVTKLLGLSTGKSSVPLIAGIIFGLAYGAGIIIESAKEENLPKRDLYLLSIFLVSSHAVIEDTAIFIPLGINVLPLLIIRVTVAFIMTMLTAKIWNKLSGRIELISKGEL